jgi:anti-sigma B factor antagonist
MAGLDVTMKPAEGDATAAIAELSGVLDSSTVGRLQETVEDAFKRGVRKLVLEMSKVRYVNSTGLGQIVQGHERLKPLGGGLALAKVSPKVKIVIEMLGLQHKLDICADERAALDALARRAGGGAPAAPPAAAPPPSATPPPFAAPPAAPGGWGAPAPAAPPPAAPAPRGGGGYPLVLPCKGCGIQVELRAPGNWKCPRCHALIGARPDGDVRFSAPDRPSPYEISMHLTREGSEALTHFIAALAHHAVGNGGATEAVRAAVGEVVHSIAANACNYDPKFVVHVSVEMGPSEIRIKFADNGKTLDGSRVDAFFPNASRAMNEFECRPHPKGGNVIRMVKRK